MRSYADEAAFIQYRDEDDTNSEDLTSVSFLQLAKDALFNVFLRMNSVKTHIALHYYALMLLVEALQLMSLMMFKSGYSEFGPYRTDSPWNLGQISWLIDVCWIFRVDRYLRFSLVLYLLLLGVISGLLFTTILLTVLLAVYKKPTALSTYSLKVLKVLSTLIPDLLFIPMLDSLVFGVKCSASPEGDCLGFQQNYLILALFCGLICGLLAVAAMCSVLYYDFCMFCGGITAKPHARFKLLRLSVYTTVVFTYYFTSENSGSVIVFLLIALGCGMLLCFVYMQYSPYYNYKILRMRLASAVAFSCAAFCLLIGECFKTTDSTNSSVTMLFYFLSPCLIQITHLGVLRCWKKLHLKPPSKLVNFFEVELKVRLLAARIFELKYDNPGCRSVAEAQISADHLKQRTSLLEEIEKTFQEAAKKFPQCEFLYLWSGLVQLHLFENYVLAIVQCFKGLQLANKLDSQYALYAFRFTSEAMYKGHMKDDAYEYVLYEKCFQSAQRNDEKVTTSQYRFWGELESTTPKIQKLNTLAGETCHMIGVAKSTYQTLIKLNTKSTQTLRMFGGFLTSLNNFSDVGQRYIQKADLEDEARSKNANANVLNAIAQPLSFFDTDNAIMTVSADFENIGEILKVNEAAARIFGYLKAEVEGRNVMLLIPQPFVDHHDEYMSRFHMTGGKNVIDNSSLCVYFVHKSGYLIQGRILIKVVPNDKLAPFLMSVIKETRPDYEFLMLTIDFVITGHSKACDAYLPLPASQAESVPIQSVITNFSELQAEVDSDLLIEAITGDPQIHPKCALKKLFLGDGRGYVLRVATGQVHKEEDHSGWGEGNVKPEGRSVSTLQHIDSVPEKPILEEEVVDQEPSNTSVSEEESDDEDDDSISGDSVSEPENGSLVIEGEGGSTGSGGKSEEKNSGAGEGGKEAEGEKKQGSEVTKTLSSRSESEVEDYAMEVNDAHSAYSSSKSMNSSMASLAQFNKSIKALISYEFQRTKRQVWRFKVTLILTIILLIVTSAVTFQVIGKSVEFNERLSLLVDKVGSMRLHAQSLAYYVRMVGLMDAGVIRSDNRSDYLRWMKEDTDLMHQLNVDLHSTSSILSPTNELIYLHSQFPSWHLDSGRIIETHTNLFDTASTLVLMASLLHSEAESEKVTLSDERAFYVYRNGEGELLGALNRSARFYVESAGSDLVKARLTAILLILTSVIVLLLCAGLAVVPTLKTLDSSKKEVWNIFLEMPPHVCRIMKGKCNERLQVLNDSAHPDLDDTALEDNPDDEKGLGVDSKSNKKTKEPDSGGKGEKASKRNKERRELAKDVRVRKVVGAKLSCFFLMSLVYFYLIYYTGFQAVGSVLEEEPVTINWASRLRLLSRSVNFWLMESLLENSTSESYKFIIPSGQHVSSAARAAQSAIWELEYVENSIIFGNADEGLSFSSVRRAEHDDLLFVNACAGTKNRSLGDCETVGDKAMMQGLHSALDMYGTLARTILQQISTLSPSELHPYASSPSFTLLRSLDDRYLYDSLNDSIVLYESDYRASQDEMKIWQQVLICVFSVCSLTLFFLVYTPMIQNLGQDTKQAWSMCTLIPQEYQEEFKRLNLVIRERRDNFVWR